LGKVAQIIEESLLVDPCLEEALDQGYANVSEAARRIRSIYGGGVSATAISSALKRRPKKSGREVLSSVAGSTITVRTGIGKISLEAGPSDMEVLERYGQKLIGFSKGLETVTFLVDEKDLDTIATKFSGRLLEKKAGLATIVVRGPTAILNQQGFLSFFLGILSKKGINVDDVASSYVDVMIILSESDASTAFGFFNAAIETARRVVNQQSAGPRSGIPNPGFYRVHRCLPDPPS